MSKLFSLKITNFSARRSCGHGAANHGKQQAGRAAAEQDGPAFGKRSARGAPVQIVLIAVPKDPAPQQATDGIFDDQEREWQDAAGVSPKKIEIPGKVQRDQPDGRSDREVLDPDERMAFDPMREQLPDQDKKIDNRRKITKIHPLIRGQRKITLSPHHSSLPQIDF